MRKYVVISIVFAPSKTPYPGNIGMIVKFVQEFLKKYLVLGFGSKDS